MFPRAVASALLAIIPAVRPGEPRERENARPMESSYREYEIKRIVKSEFRVAEFPEGEERRVPLIFTIFYVSSASITEEGKRMNGRNIC